MASHFSVSGTRFARRGMVLPGAQLLTSAYVQYPTLQSLVRRCYHSSSSMPISPALFGSSTCMGLVSVVVPEVPPVRHRHTH
jgi:hypothetical protein